MRTIFKDSINLISVLNIRKIWNVILVYSTYYLSYLMGKVFTPPHPISISIEPTNNCNLKCSQCPSGNGASQRKKGAIEPELYEKILREVSGKLCYLNLYFQGEPMLVSSFFRMVNLAKTFSLYVSASTNGHFLSEKECNQLIDSGLDRIIISLDGMSQESYAAYRIGGDLSFVLQGIETLIRIRKARGVNKPFIELQFLVFKHNEDEIPAARRYAASVGADKLSLKSAQFYDLQNDGKYLPEAEEYSRYKKLKDGTLTIKSKLHNHCFRMWSSLVIGWDGAVIPCCFDKNADYQLGNLKKEPFLEVCKGSEYSYFRSKILHDRKSIPMCCNCTEGL